MVYSRQLQEDDTNYFHLKYNRRLKLVMLLIAKASCGQMICRYIAAYFGCNLRKWELFYKMINFLYSVDVFYCNEE